MENIAGEGHKGLKANSQPLGDFCDFSEKNSNFNAIWITFGTFLEPFERTEIAKIASYMQGLNSLALQLPLTYW